ncbi:MAG TPA: MarR family winged helix-turn-helix transcriptional regulator [Patescibacteria group bacterium]|nr:MarR family winged helix-turn-helix transcriptional regulator [Patescibacteria group bacterium]
MNNVVKIGYLLTHTATILLRQSDQVLQERLGIGMSQFRLLLILEKTPNVQQRTLAERLGQTEASISRQIKLLCEKGLLVIQVNPKNRREHITVPTARGIKMTAAAMEVLDQYHDPMVDKLSEKQQQALCDMLTVFHDHVCVPGRPFACDHTFALER